MGSTPEVDGRKKAVKYMKILRKLEKQYTILVLSLNIFQMEKLEICCCAKD